jgi:prevent-host-death family protein
MGPVEEMPISTFKATCLAVLERVCRTGQPVLVTKRGAPVAQIVPPSPPGTWLGSMRGTAQIVGDVVEPVAGATEWEALR